MKSLMPIFILIFAFSSFGQIKSTPESLDKKIKTRTISELESMADKASWLIIFKYDESKDITEAIMQSAPVFRTNNETVEFHGSFSFPGKDLTGEPEFIFLNFKSLSKEWMFLDNNDLTLVVDSKEIKLGKAVRRGISGSFGTSKELVYKLKIKEREKLLAAQSLSFQIGSIKGDFKKIVLDGIKSLLELTKQ